MASVRSETSDLINVRSFLSNWDNDVYMRCAGMIEDKNAVLAERMELSAENIDELESVCSIDQLKDDDESTTDRWKLLKTIPEDIALTCVRYQRKELVKREDSKYFANMIRKMKYKTMDHRMIYDPTMEQVKKNTIPEDKRVVYPDVVITLNIHRAVKQLTTVDKYTSNNQPTNTFLVLGRQCLTDLRDSIRCVHDLTVAGDLSENPDTETQCYAKDLFKSGFFFIEGTFYSDMREPNSIDYSRPIIEWSKKQGLGSYETKKMEETTFLDLSLRLGQPYLYMHQGNCEHWFIFNSVRLLSLDDPQNTQDYPYLLRKSKKHRTLCRVCGHQAARWITYGSEHAPESPCFFCEQCFRALHYDADNKKIGQFEAYKFFDYHAII